MFLIFEWNILVVFFFCFSWRMLLEYSSLFELCILAFSERKLTKGKRSCTEENDWQINGIIWSINFQNNNGHAYTNLRPSPFIHNGPLYGSSLSYQSLTAVTKNSILDVCKGPRSICGIHDILLSYILITYLIYLEKSKTMVPFTHSF